MAISVGLISIAIGSSGVELIDGGLTGGSVGAEIPVVGGADLVKGGRGWIPDKVRQIISLSLFS